MSSTGTSIRSFSCFFSDGVDDRDRPERGRLCVVGELVVQLGFDLVDAAGSRPCRVRRFVPPAPSGRGARSRRRRETARPRRAAAAWPTGRCAAAALPPVWPAQPAARSASSRSSDSARCAPRLPGTSAWISSMITVSTVASRSRAFDVSSRNSDSGVVIRMSAGSRRNRARSVAGVSPVRMAICGHRRRRRPARCGDVGDAGERRAQVALDVHRQRLERRDVEDAAALLRRRRRLEHQAVEAPEERRERLAAAGRREDQRRLAARDRRPPELLRPGRRRERAGEPLAHRGMKQIAAASHGSRRSILIDSLEPTPGLSRIIRIDRMGDAGEGLVDAESRLAERMEEREQEKQQARQAAKGGDPERHASARVAAAWRAPRCSGSSS